MIMLTCIQQQLSNICSSIHEKVRNIEVEMKKGVAYNKNPVFKLTLQSCRKNGLIRKIRLISKFMTSQPGLQYTYCLISYEGKSNQK